jgi:divalent metal cation (Fe/Co/Zn/Cd) transporter
MRPPAAFEFPPELERPYRTAKRLEYLSLVYIASSVVFVYLVMGSSQAMRASWLENTISLVPPLAFLICTRIARMQPASRFPYGVHRAVSIGYLTASLALFGMGMFLFIESAMTLIAAERTTIGGFDIFGTTIWAGWPMLAALLYTSAPSYFLGRAKRKLASKLNDKILYADAEMNRADWMSEGAAALGVLGAGFGFWWADAVAAGLVSFDILYDGFHNIRAATTDLMDEMPKTIEGDALDPLPDELARHCEGLNWVEKVEVRMREEGHIFFSEVFVVPANERNLVTRIAELAEAAKAFNWRIHDVTVMPVSHEMLAGRGPDATPTSTPERFAGLRRLWLRR